MNYVTIQLSEEDALLFTKFQQHHETIGYLLGYMESLKLIDLRNMSVTMDIDNIGIVQHTSITRHFRP
jgi:hypothetical protein